MNWVQMDAQDYSLSQDGAAGLSETSELIQSNVITHNTIIWMPTTKAMETYVKEIYLANVSQHFIYWKIWSSLYPSALQCDQ